MWIALCLVPAAWMLAEPPQVDLDPRPVGDTPRADVTRPGSGSSDGSGSGSGSGTTRPGTGTVFDRPILTFPVTALSPWTEWAYVWSDQASKASFDPSAAYSFNSKKGKNRVTRSGTGQYQVVLGGMAQRGGHVQVTAYGTTGDYCNVRRWGPSGRDQQVLVDCFGPTGQAKDGRFSLFFTGPMSKAGWGAYAWASGQNQPKITGAYHWSAAGKDIAVKKLGTGTYEVSFAGLGAGTGAKKGANVQVTAYGGSHACLPTMWSSRGQDLVTQVRCTDAAGRAADGRFNILATWPAQSLGYVWADKATAASYSPSPTYAHNGAGGGTTIKRTDTGAYQVTFAGLADKRNTGANVQVTAYAAGRCRVAGWSKSSKDMVVRVHCTDEAGRAKDQRFSALAIW